MWGLKRRVGVDLIIISIYVLVMATLITSAIILHQRSIALDRQQRIIVDGLIQAQTNATGIGSLVVLLPVFEKVLTKVNSLMMAQRVVTGIFFSWCLIFLVVFVPAAWKAERIYRQSLKSLPQLFPSDLDKSKNQIKDLRKEESWRPGDLSLDQALEHVPSNTLNVTSVQFRRGDLAGVHKLFRVK